MARTKRQRPSPPPQETVTVKTPPNVVRSEGIITAEINEPIAPFKYFVVTIEPAIAKLMATLVFLLLTIF